MTDGRFVVHLPDHAKDHSAGRAENALGHLSAAFLLKNYVHLDRQRYQESVEDARGRRRRTIT